MKLTSSKEKRQIKIYTENKTQMPSNLNKRLCDTVAEM